jgi:hypothetical protein
MHPGEKGPLAAMPNAIYNVNADMNMFWNLTSGEEESDLWLHSDEFHLIGGHLSGWGSQRKTKRSVILTFSVRSKLRTRRTDARITV